MENVDSEKPNSTTETTICNAPGEAKNDTPATAEQQPKLHADDNSTPQEPKVKHDALTETAEAKKEAEPSVASVSAAQNGPSSTATSNPSLAPAASSTPSFLTPVKRFSAVSVNKKFLDKPSSQTTTSGGAQPATSINNSKPTATIARPTPQSASSHLRLVTSKVTGNTLLSTSPAPGWSRPQSVTPPAPSPSNQALSTGSHGTLGSSQNPFAGWPPNKPKADGTSTSIKPAWRPIGSLKPNIGSESEFPTAAEAAKGEKAKSAELKALQVAAQEAAVAQQHALSETADAFRGVHLDPNEDHWDEMGEEEDDNDFLGGVIEFGDGTQYTIQVNESTSASAPNGLPGGHASEAPISKEERFADDFDRSWPKSSASGSHGDVNLHRRPSSDASSNVSHSPVSARDPSQPRVLFNERSNRMEPATARPDKKDSSDQRGRQGSVPSGARSRVQLLHKPSQPGHADESNRPPRPIGDGRKDDALESGSTISQSSDGLGGSRRPWGPKGGLQSRPNVPDSKWMNGRRDPSNSRDASSVASSLSNADAGKSAWGGRSGPSNNETRQLGANRESERQAPPHLQRTPVDAWKDSPWSKRPPERPRAETEAPARRPPAEVEAEETASAQPPPVPVQEEQPPKSSESTHAPAPAAVPDVDEIQKAVLQDSAERAKRRRQQEEEERHKAQERARKKAAELEARMLEKASVSASHKVEAKSAAGHVNPRPSEDQVNRFIEDAISTTTVAPASSEDLVKRTGPSLKEDEKRNNSNSDPPPRPQPLSDRVNSWRTKTSSSIPQEPRSEKTEDKAVEEKHVMFASDAMHSLDLNASEDLEVFDFNDMGKLVGQNPVADFPRPSHVQLSRRPVASDYFEKSGGNLEWRNAGNRDTTINGFSRATDVENNVQEVLSEAANHNPPSLDSSSLVTDTHPSHYPSSPRFPKSPLQAYREVPLSALDDTMSRIKGALDGMHSGKVAVKEISSSLEETGETTAAHLKAEKWLPPAKRSPWTHQPIRTFVDAFSVTTIEPHMAFSHTENTAVLLPKTDRRKSCTLSKSYDYHLRSTTCSVRWDILSFDPPVEGMSKRALSLTDVLFRRPQVTHKKGFKYAVVVPKPTEIQRRPAFSDQPPIRVSIGSSRPFPSSARGDILEQKSWRSSRTVSSSGAQESSITSGNVELTVTSRSPPPDPSSLRTNSTNDEEAAKASSGSQIVPSKSKGPQMPAGASIAFYRTARESTSRVVSFTVSSELDGSSADTSESPRTRTLTSPKLDADILNIADIRSGRVEDAKSAAPPSPDSSDDQDPDGIQKKILAQSIGSLLSTTPPPSQQPSNSWAKSPARVPDPEHLKAVWSQASDKANAPKVNSLKAIADDLTAVPFSLSDVKSDDGGTPPPTALQPSRMSASEVTKAFQMVPPSPASAMSPASVRASLFTPSVTSPMMSAKSLKPSSSSTSLSHPSPANGVMRPPYSAYPHMTGHTPSPPTLMYHPHIAPTGMHHSPSGTPYGQPVWLPMGPPMMRGPQGTSYNSSLLPYHVQNGTQSGMYPPAPGPQTQPAGYPGMPPSQMMVSPVMTHAAPVPPPHMVYGASPVLLPIPAPGAPPQHSAYPVSMGMGRAGMPVRTVSDSRAQPSAHNTGNAARYNGPSYGQVPPQPYVRPTW